MTPPSNAGGEGREVLAREVLKHLREQERVGMFGKKGRIITFGEAADVIESLLAARKNADDRASALVEAAVAEMREPFVYKFGGVAYGEADMAVAQRAACAIVPLYGTGDHGEQEAAKDGRLWNDHPAVQGALRALHEAGWSEHQVRAAATPSQEAS